MRLQGRTAVVTGAASGIGRATAIRFAEEGANVVVSDIHADPIGDPDSSLPTAELITSKGGVATYVEANVSHWEDVDRLIGTAVSTYGRLDIMVNNAAVFNATSILETTEEAWDSLMAVNLRGVFLCCKRAIMQMLDQERMHDVRGRIINVTSQHGMVGPPKFFAYGVSKGGVANMTRQLAVDYGREGVIVNAVAPGRILTASHPGETGPFSDPTLDYSRSRTPFDRLGRPDDVAGAMVYLASDDCTYVLGHNLLVDGGWMAY